MNVDDMIAAVALGFESAVNKLGLVRAADAPAVPKPAAKAKRKGNPEALRKWRESKKAAPVAVAEKPAKPAKAKRTKKAAAPAKPARKTAEMRWSVEDYVTSKGVAGRIIRVGLFSAFVPNDDKAKAAELLATVNVVRGDKAAALAALRECGCGC